MVDFSKLLKEGASKKEIDPIAIFEDLDKESGKEYLRPPQKHVLEEWHKNYRNKKDIIVKLPTGQGKTLIGLLMLRSYINEGLGPAVYLCPNRYLVSQTIEHAHSFGIKTVEFSETDNSIPIEFSNSKAILVTTCNKMFNGKSVFGVARTRREPTEIGALVMDDAHKCVEIIQNSFSITVNSKKEEEEHPVYRRLFELFKESLSRQRPGTLRDIEQGRVDSIMAVPYWSWYDRQNEVVNILQEYKDDDAIRFVWDLIKDHLRESLCVFSGTKLQISPRLLPIEMIPSFTNAKRRIFISATLLEDAFLVRDLGIDPGSITNSLSQPNLKYSGERMILLPTLVDPNLNREALVEWISEIAKKKGDFGVVAIVPSFEKGNVWEYYGGKITKVENLNENIKNLKDKIKNKKAKEVIILVNEYDGVDLPDQTCRILCLDSRPSYSSLIDDYLQRIRPNSKIMHRKLAQRIEQGMGRGIRGSSDWCIVVVIADDLTAFLSENSKRAFLSNEAQMQIKIAEQLVNEMKKESDGLKAIEKLLNQCLDRDEGWKKYYKEWMDKIKITYQHTEYLDIAIKEREAEIQFKQNQYTKAIDILEELVNTNQDDEGWYFQLMATYLYPTNVKEAMNKQVKAFSKNPELFRPEEGVTYSKLAEAGSSSEQVIIEFIKESESHAHLILYINRILENISFGMPSEQFEEGIKELGRILGFASQRPQKESGQGPDNLWHIRGKEYWIISCKNMVDTSRETISKKEIGQLHNDIAWFREKYHDCQYKAVYIHPASKLADDAHINEPVWVITKSDLERLKENVRRFYNSLNIPRDRISAAIIQTQLKANRLLIDELIREYLTRVSRLH